MEEEQANEGGGGSLFACSLFLIIGAEPGERRPLCIMAWTPRPRLVQLARWEKAD